MNPLIWGTPAWILLDCIALVYPENPTSEEKDNMKNYFLYTGKVLPCPNCREHFAGHIKKHPLNDEVLSSRYNLVKWIVDMHNEVNVANKKQKLTYKQAETFLNKLSNGDIKFKLYDQTEFKVKTKKLKLKNKKK